MFKKAWKFAYIVFTRPLILLYNSICKDSLIQSWFKLFQLTSFCSQTWLLLLVCQRKVFPCNLDNFDILYNISNNYYNDILSIDIPCDEGDCGEEYIGESGRTFGERYKEHLKAPSPIVLHQNNSGHVTTLDNFIIIGREDNNLARTIKESMYIRVNNPTLNRNIGKYNLPHIWDKLLFSIPELKKN